MSRIGRHDWRRVNDLFHAALEQPAERREEHLREACTDHPALFDEVMSLLRAHERAHTFLDDARADAQLGHYRIVGVLGRGGMGVVYLAEDERLARPVALKAVAPRFTQDDTSRERLRREARAAAALSHPAVATVYALEEFESQVFIASEYVPGETLRDEIARGPLGVAQAIATGAVLARALGAAHVRQIVHRDIKPENIMRTPGGQLKILDFGLARTHGPAAPGPSLTETGALIGTPAYMSPEQIRGEPAGPPCDVFSLGVVLYELATGTHPFAGGDLASTVARTLAAAAPPLGSQVAADSSAPGQVEAFERIVHRCVHKEPAQRFASGDELADALEWLLARGLDGAQAQAPAAPPLPDRAAAQWWWKFHQGAVAMTYPLLLVPVWMARGHAGGFAGRTLFLAGTGAVVASVMLRLHLWFALRSYPAQWSQQHPFVRRWIRLSDSIFVAVLGAGALAVLDRDPALASILLGAAVGVLVSFSAIEPATARAAFGDS